MPQNPLSRRVFLGSSGALGAAAQISAQTRQAVSGDDRAQPATRVSSEPIRILTLTLFEPHELKKIEAAAPQVEVTIAKTREEFRQKLPQAEVVFGGLNGADLDYAPRVKWVQAGGAGVENLDPKFKESPIVLTNMARIFAPAISETAIGLLLCLTRGITTLICRSSISARWNRSAL